MKLKIFSMLCISLNLYIFDDKIVYTKSLRQTKEANQLFKDVGCQGKEKKGNIKHTEI